MYETIKINGILHVIWVDDVTGEEEYLSILDALHRHEGKKYHDEVMVPNLLKQIRDDME